MLNLDLGSRHDLNGTTALMTGAGVKGLAASGPHEQAPPGRYAAQFAIALVDAHGSSDDAAAASVHVVGEGGLALLARFDVVIGALRNGPAVVRVEFTLSRLTALDLRLYVTGAASLLVTELPLLTIVDGEDRPADLQAYRFPAADALPAALLQLEPQLRQLYARGARVERVDEDLVLSLAGVSFYARCEDDLRFVDEIFFRDTYNFVQDRDACVIDIGMNIGLVSMRFAARPEVKEVHAFEPFPSTYARAKANLGLNPALAAKITASNFGLAGADEELTIRIGDESDSGAFSTRSATTGAAVDIVVKDAARVLAPIIASADARGLDVVAKIDCEGSEFPIFETLEQHGLLQRISVLMVEWHRVSAKTQADLFAPLLKHGFTIFDLSGNIGNGFFYAVRRAALTPAVAEPPSGD